MSQEDDLKELKEIGDRLKRTEQGSWTFEPLQVLDNSEETYVIRTKNGVTVVSEGDYGGVMGLGNAEFIARAKDDIEWLLGYISDLKTGRKE